MRKKIMLIDGHSILNRAFYGIPDLTNSEGIHTNAMYGFLNIMFRFLDEEKPDYLTVAFDLPVPTFRHIMYKDYKGTRKAAAPEFKQQVPLMQDLLKSMGINVVTFEGFEADDIIGTIAKTSAKAGLDVVIVSGDRDLLQLCEEHIKIRIPKTKKGGTEVEDYLPENVMQVYGVTPLEFIDVKALMGDSSDNIPGAPGIGEKTATKLIAQYKSMENVFEHLEELKPKQKENIGNNIETLRQSKILVTIKTDVNLDFKIENASYENMFNEASYELFKRYNFKNMLSKFDKDMPQKELDVYENFKEVTDFGEVENIFNKLKETLEANNKIGLAVISDNSLYGLAITISKEEIYYIPCTGFVNESYLVTRLREAIKLTKDRLIVTASLKNVLKFLDTTGLGEYSDVCEEAFLDVSVGEYLLAPNNESYDYVALARNYMEINLPTRQELLNKDSFEIAKESNEENLVKYACLQSYVYFEVVDKLIENLKNMDMYELFINIEMPLIFVLYEMEKQGIRVDKQELIDYSKVLADKIKTLEANIYEAAGEEFNINSPKQLGVILFEKLGMPVKKKTKSGYSTASDVLEELALDYPIVNDILEYRQLAKLKSTYADGLTEYIGEDERIHSNFNQTITATGRISSTNPNLQNIPIRMEMGKLFRKVFIPKEGFSFIDADYSQIELRILAHMSGDEKLIESYNSDVDIHRATASHVFNTPLKEVTDLQRRNAKAVNFGIIYGISSFGLSKDLSISPKEAKQYIDQYFESYPSIKSFIDGLVAEAKDKGYSITMFNRRRPIPELTSSNFMQKKFGERIAMNAPIQGTAADIIKIAMIRVYDQLKKANLKSHLCLQVHDELLVEVANDEIDIVKEIVEKGMKEAAKLKVSLEIDLNVGKNWLECH